MSWTILYHDCERHEHGYNLVGPFPSQEEAVGFVERHDLDEPADGGYAFAVVLPESPGGTELIDPHDEMWGWGEADIEDVVAQWSTESPDRVLDYLAFTDPEERAPLAAAGLVFDEDAVLARQELMRERTRQIEERNFAEQRRGFLGRRRVKQVR